MSAAGLFLFLFKSNYRRKIPTRMAWTAWTTWTLVVIVTLGEMGRSEPVDCGRDCMNGECVSSVVEGRNMSKCVCWEGWKGPQCDLCGGKIKLNDTGPRQWIAEAAGNYTTNMKCTWYIEATKPNSTIRLHLKEFATECGWDHLYVWDGDNVFGGLQAVYSGLVRQDRFSTSRVPEIVGHSGSMLLHFYSDVAYNMTGFNITFAMDSCPSEYSENTCSGHGICRFGMCNCDQGWKGAACEIPVCPQNCGRNGECNRETRRCDCLPGWRGEDCGQEEERGYWEVADILPTEGRTSHAAVEADDYMWVVGGEFLHKQPNNAMVTRWNLRSRTWVPITVTSKRAPSERYGHSAVVHGRTIYMYGGAMRSGHVSKELWAFHLDKLSWDKVEVKRGRCNSQLCGEIHCAGHTATTVENRMIVIFGHSPRLGYLDTVQEFHFGTEEWSIIKTNGYPVKGGYGHSAVLDQVTNKIYVHGGYISKSNVQSLLSDQLYSFDHSFARWELLTASSSYRYLHTATISNGLMLVFGGNTHNDTQFSMGAKCYSADFIAYDILCDRWYSMEANIPRDFSADVPRFGHSALSVNNTIYVFGGFNGQTKSDIMMYKSGSCNYIKKKGECLNSRNGIKCVWNSKKEVCEALSADIKQSSLECVQPDQFDNKRNLTSVCQSQTSCNSCLSTNPFLECVWCNDKCHHRECPMKKEVKATTRHNDCVDSGAKEICNNLHTCDGCSAIDRCGWFEAQGPNGNSCRATVGDGGNDSDEGGAWGDEKGSTCKTPCSERKSCGNCTSGACMWCHNQQMCVDRNAYLAAFPYGQCMDWTTDFGNCKDDDSTGFPDLCKGFDTCDDCHTNPACGWCDLGSVTGLGKCLEGGASSPLKRLEGEKIKKHWRFAASSACSAGWHFTSCPTCQCNGHSNCTEKGKCNAPCQHNTQGDHCQRCTDGFFGNPVNGGDCKKCECNGQGTLCDNKSGNCFCTTKGITGNHCEKCDTQNHYFGDPIKESCFYDLAIDYQFTFNLSKPEDKHYTAINFKNIPTKPEVDVDFSIACSVPAKMNLTFRHSGKDGVRTEDVIITEKNCSQFKYRFPKSEYTFGNEDNTTFYVYLYDFTPPLWIIISFSQHPKLDLLQFFITFSTCFLALLIIAAVLWKIKQKYDRYRRRQRLFVEMEQMASRPFGQVMVELERIPDTAETHHHSRKRRKKHRPSPIALEPCEGNRAAVLSLIVRMPTGSGSYSPAGLPGVAIASSLVTLGNPRKASLDPTQKVEEQPKNNRKRRKVSANNQATDL